MSSSSSFAKLVPVSRGPPSNMGISDPSQCTYLRSQYLFVYIQACSTSPLPLLAGYTHPVVVERKEKRGSHSQRRRALLLSCEGGGGGCAAVLCLYSNRNCSLVVNMYIHTIYSSHKTILRISCRLQFDLQY